jgi:hypothetical protein
MTDSSDVCGGGRSLDDSDANGHELAHSFLDDAVIGIHDHQTLVFENRNTGLTSDPSFGVEASVAAIRRAAREPRAR